MGDIERLTFFTQASRDEFEGSVAYLESLQSNFVADQATGLIEARPNAADQIFLLFANGNLVGAYRWSQGICRQIPEQQARLGWATLTIPIHLLTLSDLAGRALWLRLESTVTEQAQGEHLSDWEALTQALRERLFTGQAQIHSPTCDALVLFWNGEAISGETVLSTFDGFEVGLVALTTRLSTPFRATLTTFPAESPAAQSCALRINAAQVGRTLLERYTELAGRRLLQMLNDDVNRMISTWRWRIRLNGSEILDRHFFPRFDEAQQAYITIFKAIRQRIQATLGPVLTARLFQDSWTQTEMSLPAAWSRLALSADELV